MGTGHARTLFSNSNVHQMKESRALNWVAMGPVAAVAMMPAARGQTLAAADLDSPGGPHVSPNGRNNSGAIVGTASNSSHGESGPPIPLRLFYGSIGQHFGQRFQANSK